MAFNFITEIAPGGKVFKSPARIHVDREGNIVDEEKADFLLVGEGGQLPWETALKLGLVSDQDTVPVIAETVIADPTATGDVEPESDQDKAPKDVAEDKAPDGVVSDEVKEPQSDKELEPETPPVVAPVATDTPATGDLPSGKANKKSRRGAGA